MTSTRARVALALLLLFAVSSVQATEPTLQRASNSAAKQIAAERATSEKRILALKASFQAQLKALEKAHADKVAEIERGYEAKLADVVKAADERVAEAQRGADDRVAAAQKAADERVAALIKEKDEATQKSEKDRKLDTLKQGLVSLKKLQSAAQVGVSFLEYGRRLIDVKAEVESILSTADDGPTKESLLKALRAYEDAHTVWNECIQYKYYQIVLGKDAKTSEILVRYGFPQTKYRGLEISDIDKKIWISHVWAAADRFLTEADAKIKVGGNES